MFRLCRPVVDKVLIIPFRDARFSDTSTVSTHRQGKTYHLSGKPRTERPVRPTIHPHRSRRDGLVSSESKTLVSSLDSPKKRKKSERHLSIPLAIRYIYPTNYNDENGQILYEPVRGGARPDEAARRRDRREDHQRTYRVGRRSVPAGRQPTAGRRRGRGLRTRGRIARHPPRNGRRLPVLRLRGHGIRNEAQCRHENRRPPRAAHPVRPTAREVPLPALSPQIPRGEVSFSGRTPSKLPKYRYLCTDFAPHCKTLPRG